MSKSKCEAKSVVNESNMQENRWDEIRKHWLQAKHENGLNESSEIKGKKVNTDEDEVIEIIFSQTGNGMLKQPVPLAQMIEMLVDFWEEDGLYE
jgi:hypothetical protein